MESQSIRYNSIIRPAPSRCIRGIPRLRRRLSLHGLNMTVAIGIVCSDGVVVASDSMGSSGMRASIAQKVHCLQDLPMAWTAAGAVYTIEEGETALRSLEAQIVSDAVAKAAWLTPDPQLIRQNLGNFLRNAMRECYQSMLGGLQPAADFLVVGWSAGTVYTGVLYWSVLIHGPKVVTWRRSSPT